MNNYGLLIRCCYTMCNKTNLGGLGTTPLPHPPLDSHGHPIGITVTENIKIFIVYQGSKMLSFKKYELYIILSSVNIFFNNMSCAHNIKLK